MNPPEKHAGSGVEQDLNTSLLAGDGKCGRWEVTPHVSKCDQNNGLSGFRLYLGTCSWLTGQQKYQRVLWHFLGCNQLASLSYQGRDSHLGRSLHGWRCHKQ